MNKIVEDMDKQIDIDREIIAILPKQEIKELQVLISKIDEVKLQYSNFKNSIYKEILKRYNEYVSIQKNSRILKITEEIENLNNKIDIINKRSSYEKLGLDKLEYDINGYYKKSLKEINVEIIECLKKYQKLGIEIKAEQFDISEYVKEYMTKLLENAEKLEENNKEIEEVFEKIYWKCPEIINHIYVNIRTIYDENKNKIEKAFKESIERYHEKLDENELEMQKWKLIKEKEKLENIDEKTILEKFISGELNINDFKKNNYENIYKELIQKDFENLSEKEKNDLDENFSKLNRNINEYFKFLQIGYLNDEILKIRKEEKTKLEQQVKEKKKTKPESFDIEIEIKNKINDLKKENQKFNKKFVKENEEEIRLKRNKIILELKTLYLNLDKATFKERIVREIEDTASLLDVLKFASYNYEFLSKCIIKKEPDITDGEIQRKIIEIRELVKETAFEVINNICISDEKSVSLTIKDRYKLFGINLQKENFQEDNIEDLIKRVKLICDYNNIQKSTYTVENFSYILKAKELQKK